MYSTTTSHWGLIRVSTDKGYLRLQFPSALSRTFYGKRQFFKGLGRPDTPQNREWAERLVSRMQADIDHPDASKLFDPSLEKYLGIKVDNVIAHPSSNSLQLKELWFEFIEFKLRTGKIAQTTYKTRYKRTFSNWLEPYLDETLSYELAERITFDLLDKVYKPNLKKMITALKEACDRAIGQGKLHCNFFANLTDSIKVSKKSRQLSEEEDYRAFSLKERDIILKSFRQSNKLAERQIADLIEFLFLTGCRLGEVFALKWQDVKQDWIVFDESYSSETKITGPTKTDTIRIFRTKGYGRLNGLIDRLRTKPHKNSDYIFTTVTGKQYDRYKVSSVWLGSDKSKNGVAYYYPGVVARLVDEGDISQYLKPSATRHTFITLQAHNGVDLKLLADSVGNSVDVIYNHYLGVNREATLADI
ncbi:MAG: tyrosine-type recombinase/integrase [Cyanosarcina radialis HA8281-LM2]|jgi:integrase|nr:tyrosine-type recombinase/integrase [Cyanosarcina radialis HA8281-LM2]